jgi:hypothetical protein
MDSHIFMCIKTTVVFQNAQWEELPDSPNLCDAAIELLTPNLGVQFYIYMVDWILSFTYIGT